MLSCPLFLHHNNNIICVFVSLDLIYHCYYYCCCCCYYSQSGKSKPAYLTLSKDKFTIYITSYQFKAGKVGKNMTSVRRPLLRKVTSIGSNDDEKSDVRAIDVGSLDRVQKGQSTLKFELAR